MGAGGGKRPKFEMLVSQNASNRLNGQSTQHELSVVTGLAVLAQIWPSCQAATATGRIACEEDAS